MIKKYEIFVESLARPDKSLPIINRTKEINGADVLQILDENCKNFSFSNTQLWRSRAKKYNFELFKPAPRNADPLAFKDFFNDIANKTDEYPVVRKNSLIGGTDKDICERIVKGDVYLVIPFDDSEIVFCPVFDLWAMSDDRKKVNLQNIDSLTDDVINLDGKNMTIDGRAISKDDFTKVTYTENFQYLDKGKGGNGCEFFLSSPCVLIHESKIEWLKKNLNRD
jgi:hypothetical protein